MTALWLMMAGLNGGGENHEPELHQYSFTTVATGAMRSAVSSEYRARSRRLRTVSLYDSIPSTEGLTYADVL